jgi:hypothetical protein
MAVTGLIGLGFALGLAPVLGPMIQDAGNRPDLETGLLQNITLSADLLAFVTPSEMHPWWGEWARGLADNFSSTTSERLIFAGFVPLALAVFGVIRQWPQPPVRFWTLMVLVFFVLALGPYLHVGGERVTIGSRPVPLPYLLLYDTVPFINLTRSLSRYDLMVMLGLGVLVAAGLAQLTISNEQLTKSNAQTTHYAPRLTMLALRLISRTPYLIPFLAVILICFEFLVIPYPISKVDIPQFYFDLAAEPEDFIIAELPMNWDRPTPLLHQTAHGKRLLTAYTSRANPFELSRRIPVFQHWRNLGPDIIDQPLEQIAPTIFSDFNLRYIVLDYWQMPPGPERTETERWVAAALPEGYAPIYDDGRLKVYRSPDKMATEPYLSLGQGWAERREQAQGLVTRTISGRPAELFLHHPQSQALSLEITAATTGSDGRRLVILADEQPIDELEITSTPATYAITLPALDGELVKLSVQPDGPDGIVISRVSLNKDIGF